MCTFFGQLSPAGKTTTSWDANSQSQAKRLRVDHHSATPALLKIKNPPPTGSGHRNYCDLYCRPTNCIFWLNSFG